MPVNTQARPRFIFIFIFISSLAFGQNVSKNISDFIKILNCKPTENQVQRLKMSLTSHDTLEYSLAISILFRNFPEEYKTKMIDAFTIPYQDTKRAIVTKFYKPDEVSQVDKEISDWFDKKYDLKKKEKEAIHMLYTFIEYRKRNVWIYKSEEISIPITIALRGGYLKGLLEETMDYKKFISEITEREKKDYEK